MYIRKQHKRMLEKRTDWHKKINKRRAFEFMRRREEYMTDDDLRQEELDE